MKNQNKFQNLTQEKKNKLIYINIILTNGLFLSIINNRHAKDRAMYKIIEEGCHKWYVARKTLQYYRSKDVRTVIYQVNKTEKEFLQTHQKFTIQRLDFSEELRGENTRKTFYLDDPSDNEDQLVILSFGKERVVVNMALLEGNKISISKRPMPLKLDSLYAETETEYKDFRYTPNLKRPICIIDPETTEEIKPILYFDEKQMKLKVNVN